MYNNVLLLLSLLYKIAERDHRHLSSRGDMLFHGYDAIAYIFDNRFTSQDVSVIQMF